MPLPYPREETFQVVQVLVKGPDERPRVPLGSAVPAQVEGAHSIPVPGQLFRHVHVATGVLSITMDDHDPCFGSALRAPLLLEQPEPVIGFIGPCRMRRPHSVPSIALVATTKLSGEL